MKRKFRNWLRFWIPRVVSIFEPAGRKGRWFEEHYYTYLFTRSKNYSTVEPNEEEKQRWQHIELLVQEALKISKKEKFFQILDFGCGRGWLTKELSVYGPVIGIEPITKVVEYGKKIYPGLTLRTGDLQSLSGLKSDLIVCSEVVEHLGKDRVPVYFKAFRNSLIPGGFLIITTPRQEAFSDWCRFAKLDQPTEDWLKEAEIKKLGEEEGLEVIRKITYGRQPQEGAPIVQIYQQWLFRERVVF